MSGNKLQFKLINYYPEVLESFTVYFLKEDSKSSIIITGSDISEPLIMEHNPALINLLKSPFKAFGATASEARDAINALGKGESFVDSYDSDVVYIPSNTLNKQLEELGVGRYLISNVQLGQYSLPFNASESGGFIYLEIKKTYRDLELGFKLEAWGYSTGVKKVKVSNSEGVWSNWKTFAFTDGNVASADKLKTARTIAGVSFDGTKNIEIPRANLTGTQGIETISNLSVFLSEKARYIKGRYAFGNDEVNEIINAIPSNLEVFNSWYRFSQWSNNLSPGKPEELQGWNYDQTGDYFYSTINSESHIGLVSPTLYEDYDLLVEIGLRPGGTDSDDDTIALVIAFNKDFSGKEQTLIVKRSPGGEGRCYSIDLDKKTFNGQTIVADGDHLVKMGNGSYRNSGGATVPWKTTGRCLLKIQRRGDVIKTWTSDFGNTTDVLESTLLEIDLSSNPLLEVFRGPKPYGFSALSQKDSYWKVINFTSPSDKIIDLESNKQYQYTEGSGWTEDTVSSFPSIPNETFLYNDLTQKIYFYENSSKPVLKLREALKLASGKNIKIGKTTKVFDGSSDLIWSLGDIGGAEVFIHDASTKVIDFNNLISNTVTLNRIVWNTNNPYFLNGPVSGQSGILITAFGSHERWNIQIFYAQSASDIAVYIRGSYDASGTTAWTPWVRQANMNDVILKSAGVISGSNLNLASASHFKKTISAATTFTLSNIPSSGRFYSFILEITDGGAFPVTWWANIKWPGGFAPTLTVSGTDIFSFFTTDGGATWKTTGLNIM